MCQQFKLVAFYSGYVDVTPEVQALAEDLPCDALMLSIWNTEDDTSDTYFTKDADQTYDEANLEIYWGFGNVCGHQLFPKQTTPSIGVRNAHDISIRCSTKKSGGVHRVFFTAFRYQPIKGATKSCDQH